MQYWDHRRKPTLPQTPIQEAPPYLQLRLSQSPLQLQQIWPGNQTAIALPQHEQK